jgi:outer membrane protein OmpU
VSDEANGGGLGDSTNYSDFTVFISGGGHTLTMGDTDGAFDWALQEVNIGSPGSIADNETGHAGYNGNGGLDGHYDGQVLRYDYSFGDFSVALSVEQDDDGSAFLDNVGVANVLPLYAQDADVTGDPVWGIGAKYSGMFAGGTFGVGIGYQFNNDAYQDGVTVPRPALDADILGLSAHVELDMGLSAAINYSELDTNVAGVDVTHMGIGASYAFDAITLHANYGSYDRGALAGADSDGFGLAASYDFGGGLTAHLGYGYSDVDGAGDSSSWSLGLAMSF